jgi:hypothetical protein
MCATCVKESEIFIVSTYLIKYNFFALCLIKCFIRRSIIDINTITTNITTITIIIIVGTTKAIAPLETHLEVKVRHVEMFLALFHLLDWVRVVMTVCAVFNKSVIVWRRGVLLRA